MTYLPTKPAKARIGEPYSLREILEAQIQREDRGIEGFVREPINMEAMQRELPDTKWSPVSRYVFGLNITRFMHSLI